MNNTKLNNFEKEIEKNAESYTSVNIKKRNTIEKIIDTSNKKKSVNLRLNEHDLLLLKQHAEKSGIPYQTLISSILHKYLTNQLIDEKSIIKAIKLLKEKI